MAAEDFTRPLAVVDVDTMTEIENALDQARLFVERHLEREHARPLVVVLKNAHEKAKKALA